MLSANWGRAQDLRGYGFLAPTPNNGQFSPTSFGILPAPPPLVPPNSQAYGAGLGLEQRFNRFLGAGIEANGIMPGSGRIFDNTVGVFSANSYVHIPPRANWRDVKLDWYASGGYSLILQDFTANAFNVGGGMNYWFHERLGLMAEFRLLRTFGTAPAAIATQYYEIRFGLTFR